MEILLNIYVT